MKAVIRSAGMFAGVIMLAVVIGLLLIWRQYLAFPNQVLIPAAAQPRTLLIEPGSSYRHMVLQARSVTEAPAPWLWRLYGRVHEPVIHAGEYRLEPGITVGQWLRKLQRGEVVQYAVTLIEGWTTAQIFQHLQKQTELDTAALDRDAAALHADLLEMTGSELLQTAAARVRGAALSDASLLEGMFLPETWHFHRGENVMNLLVRMHRALSDTLMQSWNGYRQRVAPGEQVLESPYDLLVLASIVEKETALAHERRMIAGVLHRRLQRDMLLQTDPTVIYGLGERFDGDIRSRDLLTDSAYNTYMRRGLPPTPIANPGARAIAAAGDPDDGEALYFVASGEGGHVFSATLQEHQQAVREYLRKIRTARKTNEK